MKAAHRSLLTKIATGQRHRSTQASYDALVTGGFAVYMEGQGWEATPEGLRVLRVKPIVGLCDGEFIGKALPDVLALGCTTKAEMNVWRDGPQHDAWAETMIERIEALPNVCHGTDAEQSANVVQRARALANLRAFRGVMLVQP